MENKLKISENTVVHCTTEELANEVLKIAHNLGYKWKGGDSYLKDNYWRFNNVDTCYNLHRGKMDSIDYYKNKLKPSEIISAQDFIALHDPKEENIYLLKKIMKETSKEEIKFTPSTEDIIKAKIGKITKLELIPTGEGIKESDGKLNYELDFEFIQAMAERMFKNKNKYPPYNWKKPIDVESLKQSLFRHVIEVMKGNYEDDGMGLGHVLGVALNAMMIHYQLKHNK